DLAAAIRGDGSALESSAAPALTAAGWAALLPSVAIQCADGAARRKSRAWPQVIGKLKRQSPLQGILQGWWEWAPCASWAKRGQDTYRGPWTADTPNPVLLVNSTFDPNTAYVNAVKVEKLLGNAVLLTHDGYGHLAFQDPSKCVEEAEAAYLTELTVPAKGTVCASDRTPFDPDFGLPLP
ncbi:MAG: alpha/beta hydrolase, partial [Actinomycetota bacterium]|nr:alpha/beta hydrolase [Actinomycetota bacterium]